MKCLKTDENAEVGLEDATWRSDPDTFHADWYKAQQMSTNTGRK